ncbi:MAG: SUMF1/EgtB/PvdO family nonheme iron enzyme [Deltaproteobacteria bacterium]|nr:SUMF1/EgtB/PvdO family nonheme iron enzyme [Deltaproteobacteria bacterium]
MRPIVTYEGIDEAIKNLRYTSRNSLKSKLINTIREQYHSSGGSVDSVKEIDTDFLVKTLWEIGDDPLLIRSKRKNYNSIKSTVNSDLKKLYSDGLNKEGIIINQKNIFDMSEEAKSEILESFSYGGQGNSQIPLDKITDVLSVINDFISNKESGIEASEKFEQLKELIRDISGKVGISIVSQGGMATGAQPVQGEGAGEMVYSVQPQSPFIIEEQENGSGETEDEQFEEIELTDLPEEELEDADEDEVEIIEEPVEEPLDEMDEFEEVPEEELDELSEEEAEDEIIDDIEEVPDEELEEISEDEIEDEAVDEIEDEELQEVDIEEAPEEELEDADEDEVEIVEEPVEETLDEVDELEEVPEEGLEEEFDEDDVKIIEEPLDEVDELEEIPEEELEELSEDEAEGGPLDELEDVPEEELEEISEDEIEDEEVEEVDIEEAPEEGLEEEFDEDDVEIIEEPVEESFDDVDELEEAPYEELKEISEDELDVESLDDIEEVPEEELEEVSVDEIEDEAVDEIEEEEVDDVDIEDASEDGLEEDIEEDIDEDEVEIIEEPLEEVDELEEVPEEELEEQPEDEVEDEPLDELEEVPEEELEEVFEDEIEDEEVNEVDIEEAPEEELEDLPADELIDDIEEVTEEELDEISEDEIEDDDYTLEEILDDYDTTGYISEEGQEKALILADRFDKMLSDTERYYNRYLLIPAGRFLMVNASSKADKKEQRFIDLPEFYFGKFPVTNHLFELFTEKTGYVTTAERLGYGMVYKGRFRYMTDDRSGRKVLEWNSSLSSEKIEGACWFQPLGHGSTLHGKRNHPVVQVTLEDAMAFAAWTGKRLPTEQEWEAAARTSLGLDYPWGKKPGKDKCNIEASSIGDTAPVDKYQKGANKYEIYDLIGNVMEWTASSESQENSALFVAKGGSWVSGENITLTARSLIDPKSPSNLLGFRCIAYNK